MVQRGHEVSHQPLLSEAAILCSRLYSKPHILKILCQDGNFILCSGTKEHPYGRGLIFLQHLLGKKKERRYTNASSNKIMTGMRVMHETPAQGPQHVHVLPGLQPGQCLRPFADNLEQYLEHASFCYLVHGKRPAQ
jgi:hypothetical protein